MKRRYDLYLRDMVEAIDRIFSFVDDKTLTDLKKNRLVLDAVTRNLEILGEAVAQLPDAVKKRYPDIAWRTIKDFRNVVIHKYWVVDEGMLWEIITTKLEPLRKEIVDILEKEA